MRHDPRAVRLNLVLGLIGLASLAAARPAAAEGYEDVGDQNLVGSLAGVTYTTAYVDILDADNEIIAYTTTRTSSSSGADSGNDITVYGPDGSLIGTYGNGDEITPTAGEGSYQITWESPEYNYWDITVNDATTGDPVGDGGRLWSYAWYFNAGSYAEAASFTGSFYAKVDAGDGVNTGVIEMLSDGLAGYEWVAAANSYGLEAPYSGYSVDYAIYSDATFTADYPLYLNPPADATYTFSEPEVSGEAVYSDGGDCDTISPGEIEGGFTFSSSVDGTYRIVCDTDGDGTYDLSGASDLSLSGEATAGVNVVPWDGLDATGEPLTAGDYTCAIYITAGEYHYVAADVETSYQGLRMFEVQADGARVGLDMFWNDTLAPVGTVTTMPGGETPATDSGAFGVNAGAYEDAFDADPTSDGYNARGWGAFVIGSMGDNAFLDTYAFLTIGGGGEVSVSIVSSELDSDGDGISDVLEDCTYGTDPDDADGDDDGVLDGDELGEGEAPRDSDGDGVADVADADDDDDGVPTEDEGGVDLDTDDDGLADYLDEDDDGDGVPTSDEGDENADGDGTPDRLDTDSDGDGFSDGDEGLGDTDGDGLSDLDDADDDGDGWASLDEGAGDTDGDETPDYLDPDDDGDGISTEDEGAGDIDGDGTADARDLDSDDDGLTDAEEGTTDTDGDGVPDFQDAVEDGGETGETGETGGGETGLPDSGETGDGLGSKDYYQGGCACSTASPRGGIGAFGLALVAALGLRRRRA